MASGRGLLLWHCRSGNLCIQYVRENPTVFISVESDAEKIHLPGLHHFSPKCAGDLIMVNCEAIPESHLESKLFGYEGALTNARKEGKPGKFELANGGPHSLMRWGLPLHMQTEILHVLQRRCVI